MGPIPTGCCYVIDASVAAKWLLTEEHTDEAENLLVEGIALSAPDLLYTEIGNALWKRVRAREMTLDMGREALVRLREIDVIVTPASLLLDHAFELACEHRRTVYDSIYLALALQEDSVLVTADQRFYNAMRRTPLADKVEWIGGMAPA